MGRIMVVEERKVDSHGRVSLPVEWRRKYLKESDEVVILYRDGELLLKPKEARPLSEFFDSLEVELEADLDDWHMVKRELLGE